MNTVYNRHMTIIDPATGRKMCPRCNGKRPRMELPDGKLHGYCKTCRREYQRDLMRRRDKPDQGPPCPDGRGNGRRVREFLAAAKKDGSFIPCHLCEEPAYHGTEPPTCPDHLGLPERQLLSEDPEARYKRQLRELDDVWGPPPEDFGEYVPPELREPR